MPTSSPNWRFLSTINLARPVSGLSACSRCPCHGPGTTRSRRGLQLEADRQATHEPPQLVGRLVALAAGGQLLIIPAQARVQPATLLAQTARPEGHRLEDATADGHQGRGVVDRCL